LPSQPANIQHDAFGQPDGVFGSFVPGHGYLSNSKNYEIEATIT
jgi:hypothetical protein